MQNGIGEAFNGRMRGELPDETLFFDLAQARGKVANRLTDYNHNRPHSAIGYETPAAFMARLIATAAGSAGRKRATGHPNAPPALRCSIGATAPK